MNEGTFQSPESVSPTFCVLPWIQLASKPDGRLNLCCLATQSILKDENGRDLRMNRDSFEKIWNSGLLKNTRNKMLAGESISACGICYKSEANKQPSVRQTMNRVWTGRIGADEINRRIEESRQNEGAIMSPPVSWDLRLSNKCNLQCRMCFPANSHKLNLEYNKIAASGLPFPKDYHSPTNEEARAALNWSDSDTFQKSMEQALPYARELYFTGGEPMIIQATYELLKKACDLGVAKNISVRFHTNTTVWNEKIMDLLPEFATTDIICSIDGSEKTDNYIRYPTKFEQVDEIFKKYLGFSENSTNVFLAINTAISWQNVFDLPQFAKWFLQFDLQSKKQFRGIYYNQIYFPQHLSFKMIPEHLRPAAIAAVRETLDLHNAQYSKPHQDQSLNSFLNVLQEPANSSRLESEHLVSHTESLDIVRKQHLKDFIPSAYPVFQFHKETSNRVFERPILHGEIPVIDQIP